MREFQFDDKFTYGDWNTRVLDGWSISPAQAKTKYIDVPEADGQLDLTEALTGEVTYDLRDFKATLQLQETELIDRELKRRVISNFLSGKRRKLFVPETPDYYMIGRFSILSDNKTLASESMEIEAKLEPWLYKADITQRTFSVSGMKTITLTNERRTAIPDVMTTANVNLTFGSQTVSLSAGTATLVDLALPAGDSQITITGNATVTFSYQEASL